VPTNGVHSPAGHPAAGNLGAGIPDAQPRDVFHRKIPMKRMTWAAAAPALLLIAGGTVFAASPTPVPSDEEEMTAAEFDALMATGEWTITSSYTDENGVTHVDVLSTMGGTSSTRSVTISPDG